MFVSLSNHLYGQGQYSAANRGYYGVRVSFLGPMLLLLPLLNLLSLRDLCHEPLFWDPHLEDSLRCLCVHLITPSSLRLPFWSHIPNYTKGFVTHRDNHEISCGPSGGILLLFPGSPAAFPGVHAPLSFLRGTCGLDPLTLGWDACCSVVTPDTLSGYLFLFHPCLGRAFCPSCPLWNQVEIMGFRAAGVCDMPGMGLSNAHLELSLKLCHGSID